MTEIILSILLAGTNIYWAYICILLVNRLMSRDFSEFKLADKYPIKKKQEIRIEEPDEFAEQQASQVNALLNLA